MRRLFGKIHLWLSIPFGLIIALVCLTGAILVFEDEILQFCYPSRYYVKEVKGELLPPAELMKAARRQLPDSIQINGLRIFPDPERTNQVVLPGKKAVAFIDPYTGQLTGVDDGQGFFMQTMRIHRWLFDTYKRDGSFSWGKNIVGYATLALAIILVSGLVIWWPRNRKMLSNRLKIQTRKGWFRFFYDLHVAGGFYTTLLLLALTLTGLTWSFGWYRNAFYAVFGVETTSPRQQEVHAPASERKSEGKHASGKGDRQAKRTDYTQWGAVLADLQSRYPHYNYITLQDGKASVSFARYGNTRGGDSYTFDPKTGEITDTQLYCDLPKSGKIRGWIYSVHVGTWGGVTTQILSCLASLLGAVFALTGYYFWIRKKRGKKGTREKPNSVGSK